MPRRLIPLLTLIIMMASLLPATPTLAEPRCFPEAGIPHCIDEPFRSYWEQQGGLPIFGYPLSAPFAEQTDAGAIQVQLFERARLEHHPTNAPPYHILLSHLGRQATGIQGPPPGAPEQPLDGCRYFAETGLNVCPPFLNTWRSYGLELGDPGISEAESLALFGLPLTPVHPTTLSNGQTYMVQWFERARFEDHGQQGVLLGLLGSEVGGGGALPQAPAVEPWHNPYGPQEPGGFIEVAGSQLVRQGQPIRLKGVNYYPQWRPWDEMWTRWDASQMERELRLARDQLGINAVRILIPYDAFGDGHVDEKLIQRLREVCQIAGSLDMRLIVSLFDFYEGFPQPGSDSERKNFEYIHRLVGNFIGDERIFAWDIHNEPDNYTKWKEGRADEVLTWLGRMADKIHSIDPYHPVTVGMAHYNNLWIPGPDGRRVIDYSDVVSVHIYNSADAARQLDELRSHTDKPIILEEFGWPTGPRCSREGYNEAQQEHVYREMLAAADSRVAGVFAWTLRDYDAGPTMRWDTREEYYGLYRPDDSLKPAALVLRDFGGAPPLPTIIHTDDPLTGDFDLSFNGEKAPRQVGDTPYYVKNWFRRAWEHLGGQGSLGRPLSNAFVRPEDEMVVQYFENAVLELHDEAIFDPDFDQLTTPQQVMRVVRPAYLGYDYTTGRSFPPPDGSQGGGFFPETGYSVRGDFWSFYANLLGPWRLGVAISGEVPEEVNGTPMMVQYFEKGRLEFNPNYNTVQFSQMGRWAWQERCRALGEQP